MADRIDQPHGHSHGQPQGVPMPGAAIESAQTRAATDKGALRDKIPVEDPATAPMGTDSESSGVRPQGLAAQAGAATPPDTASDWPEGQRAGPVPSTSASMGALVGGLVLALVVGAVVLFLAGVL
jgi:hypothetical protein